MSTRLSTLLVVMGLSLLPPLAAGADEAADKKAEIQRKKEEARKRALDKAAADKAAAAKAAADKAAADKAAADKAAADKAAADKAAADKAKAGGGGASGTGGKGNSAGAGGAAETKAADKDAKAADKAADKDAPLPAGNSEALRKDRPERRKSSVERLRKRWGRVLASDKGAADLKLHARRVALLQRARVIAEAKKDTKSVELVDQLLTAEDERHSTAMNALREGALK